MRCRCSVADPATAGANPVKISPPRETEEPRVHLGGPGFFVVCGRNHVKDAQTNEGLRFLTWYLSLPSARMRCRVRCSNDLGSPAGRGRHEPYAPNPFRACITSLRHPLTNEFGHLPRLRRVRRPNSPLDATMIYCERPSTCRPTLHELARQPAHDDDLAERARRLDINISAAARKGAAKAVRAALA